MRNQVIISLALVVSACGGETPDPIADATQTVATGPSVRIEPSSSYDEAYTAAVAAIEVAARKGHAWTTSDQLIKDAAKAAEGGDETLAISLADEARIHAELAAIQADDSAKSWRDVVISE
jgi:hypothetical protein